MSLRMMSLRYSWLVAAAMSAALALSAVAVAVPASASAKETAHAATVTINVTATDYHFKLSATSAKPGKVTFKLSNKGETSHDFKIDGVTSKLISPGQSTSITVTFKKAGSYPYLCTVPGHAALGMKGNFKVT
jgi:uncharacterized cupredoxin-like copper-binding protein